MAVNLRSTSLPFVRSLVLPLKEIQLNTQPVTVKLKDYTEQFKKNVSGGFKLTERLSIMLVTGLTGILLGTIPKELMEDME